MPQCSVGTGLMVQLNWSKCTEQMTLDHLKKNLKSFPGTAD